MDNGRIYELPITDFFGRILYSTDEVCCLGNYYYRINDAAEFLEFLRFLCQHENNAEPILRTLGAEPAI
ncbi:hypothetical protein [Loigolactobacillus zhaoyuanensis]|uniref:Uncharacterized protein n=1 Tax=Loigolactobacillus zhaoyuanensis TaxID=2486017 RepID=A0ABW8UFV5_9LACO|nr:hypothetical protein [Loigolactobacillus zhaoyuanensis]